MAVVFKEDEEKDEQPGQTAGFMSGGPSIGQGQTASVNRQQQSSGQAPSIRKYMEANQGGGQQLASGLQQQAQKQADSLKRDVTSSRQAFGQKTGELESKLGEQGQQNIKMAFKDPQAILQNQDQLSEFKKLQSGGYQEDINQTAKNLTPFQQKLQQLQQAGQMAGTESGRFQLLQQTFGKPTYSQGQQRLDQLLLQGTPNASRNLQYNISELAKQRQEEIGEFGAEQEAKLSALRNLSSERSNQIQNMLQFGESQDAIESDLSGRGLRDIQSDLESRLEQTKISAPQEVAAIRERIANNTVTPQDIQKLGLSAGKQIYDLDLNKYVNQTSVNPTLAGIANQDEFSRFQALRQLAGDTEADIFGGENNIGTYKPFEINDRFYEDLADREKFAKEQLGLLTSGLMSIEDSDRYGGLLDFNKNSVSNIDDFKQAQSYISNFNKNLNENIQKFAAQDLLRELMEKTPYSGRSFQETGLAWRGPQLTPEQISELSFEDAIKLMRQNYRSLHKYSGNTANASALRPFLALTGHKKYGASPDYLASQLRSGKSLVEALGGSKPSQDSNRSAIEGLLRAEAAMKELERIKFNRTLGENIGVETGGYFNVT